MTYGFKNAGRGSATSAVCVALFVALLLPATSSADPASLRRWPYPFSGVMSFASDVDMQPPWYGAAFHGAVNEELGLPISDSLWVSGAGSGQSNLLSSVDEINRTPSGWNGHSTFGLLVRQWHRGNIDIFHSWQNDAWVRLYEDFVPAAQLLSSAVELKLAPAPPESAEMKYQVLRLFFDGNPPEDLVVVLKDAGGNKAVASDLKRFHLLHRNGAPYAVEALLETIGDATVWKSSPGFSLQALRTVEIQAQSCSAGCKAGVTRLERDGFSRSVVARQLPIVEGLNLRPAILTSHGGYTYVQNFGYEGC